MWAICARECKELFKGIRPIIIIGILLGVSYLSARLASVFPGNIEGVTKQDIYTTGLSVSIFFFGLLFVFTLSHSTINREVESRTMRFLVTKTSRNNILFGKLLGIILFWFIIVTVCLIVTTFFSKSLHYMMLLECMVFLFYCISAAVLLSHVSVQTRSIHVSWNSAFLASSWFILMGYYVRKILY
ncbi:ABC transporter permease subunit [Halobacillus naozhouensis]|uniref:ABC transporter permease subunit n=1 Tax=Halobacillus naozhouensis TaxID=554880 RepID=UPI0036283C29